MFYFAKIKKMINKKFMSTVHAGMTDRMRPEKLVIHPIPKIYIMNLAWGR
jgi:hypothetical protein